MAIATGTALLMAGLASAGTQAYATKKAGDTNKRSLDAQAKAEAEALAYEREEAARRERQYKEEAAFRDRAYRETLAADQSRWNDYARIMAPHWGVGSQALAGLSDLMGGAVPTGGAGMPAAVPGPPVGGGVPLQPLAAVGQLGRASVASRAPRRIQAPGATNTIAANPLGAVQSLMSLADLAGLARPSVNAGLQV